MSNEPQSAPPTAEKRGQGLYYWTRVSLSCLIICGGLTWLLGPRMGALLTLIYIGVLYLVVALARAAERQKQRLQGTENDRTSPDER